MKTSVLGPQRVFLFGVAIALMLAQAGACRRDLVGACLEAASPAPAGIASPAQARKDLAHGEAQWQMPLHRVRLLPPDREPRPDIDGRASVVMAHVVQAGGRV
jgi:hypothetical protein